MYIPYPPVGTGTHRNENMFLFQVTYTVTSENGYSQTYMMICSKSLDQASHSSFYLLETMNITIYQNYNNFACQGLDR